MQTKYPTDVGDAATIKENILFKTAGYHYELVKAIQSFTGETSYDGARQEAVMKTIQQQMNLTLPKIPSKTSFVLPKLGPLKGESELESFNRIICLMRFAKKLMTTSNFAIRLGTRSSFKSFQPAISHYPLWMREEQSEDVEPLVQAPQLPPKIFTLKLLIKSKDPACIQARRHAQDWSPTNPRDSNADPRVLSREQFLDSLRGQFDLKAVGLTFTMSPRSSPKKIRKILKRITSWKYGRIRSCGQTCKNYATLRPTLRSRSNSG